MKKTNPWIKALKECAKHYQEKKKKKILNELHQISKKKIFTHNKTRLRNKYSIN